MRQCLFRLLLLCALTCGWLIATADGARAEADTSTTLPAASGAPARVLLLGNSYTRFNVMPRMLGKLARGAGLRLQSHSRARAGFTLRMHWRARELRQEILRGRYSHVVLQDHSLRPVNRPAEFEQYIERFANLSRRGGAEPIYYETWPRHPAAAAFYRTHPQLHTAEQMAARVGQAYREAVTRHGGRLAPVGRAFLTTLGKHPELELYKADLAHPTWAGSYLAACIIFGTITGQDPRGSQYVPWELGTEQARQLRVIAAEVLGL
ncbi:MAG: hypothetical protein OEZ06_09585 [Myxococcales bacterium]|nr:hypothetical protein [Myxococcales bacterium]